MVSFISWVVSFVWSFLTAVRRFTVKKGYFVVKCPVDLDCRVMSVGNIQVGGAGKTPLVVWIVHQALNRKQRVAILSRGYRGTWEKTGGIIAPNSTPVSPDICGDEVALLQHLCPEVWIGVGASRVEQYFKIQQKGISLDLVVLDDGFQNFQVNKNLEIVALTSFSSSQVLFRDFSSALSHADLLVWTKGTLFPKGIKESQKPWVRVSYEVDQNSVSGDFYEFPLWLITGVANPRSVVDLIQSSGGSLFKSTFLRDHAKYNQTWLKEKLMIARKKGYRLITTGKDWVKWRSLGVHYSDIIVIEPRLKVIEGSETWCRVLWGE